MPLLIRFAISILILVITYPFIKAGPYTNFAVILAILGTVALVCGSHMTGSGFKVGSPVRHVTVDQETPGCVWKMWGWFCWIVVILMVLGYRE